VNLEKKNEWLSELVEFSKLSPSKAPAGLLPKLKTQLFPSPFVVFGKIATLHGVVGFLSLAICDQFGLNPFNTNQSLTAWFMSLGSHNVCMVLCGMFFMATTYLLANLFLRFEELESIKRNERLQLCVICLTSLAIFAFFGANLGASIVALWLFGAFGGGLLSIELSYRLRRELVA
jgi:hypothetical protein